MENILRTTSKGKLCDVAYNRVWRMNDYLLLSHALRWGNWLLCCLKQLNGSLSNGSINPSLKDSETWISIFHIECHIKHKMHHDVQYLCEWQYKWICEDVIVARSFILQSKNISTWVGANWSRGYNGRCRTSFSLILAAMTIPAATASPCSHTPYPCMHTRKSWTYCDFIFLYRQDEIAQQWW